MGSIKIAMIELTKLGLSGFELCMAAEGGEDGRGQGWRYLA